MIKALLTAGLLTLSLGAMADILVIGDSHTVGPFGTNLHKNLASALPDKMIMVYGHSSSAPVHWMGSKPVMLSGGINHHMSFGETYLDHPNLPHWRILQPSQNLLKVLNEPVIHPQWKVKIPMKPTIDTIVIALGANDRGAVSTDSGTRTTEYAKRVQIINDLLNETESRGIKCIWIGPPSSITRSKAKEQTTHDYLVEGINNRCPLYDSRKFVAKFCDKVHFNCPPAMPDARKWAREAADFVLTHL